MFYDKSVKKIPYIIFPLLFIFLFTSSQKASSAFECDITTDPTPITDGRNSIRVLTIDGKDNFNTGKKYVWLDDYAQGSDGFTPVDGKITVENAINSRSFAFFKPPSINVKVREVNDISKTPICSAQIPVGYACTVSLSPDKLTPLTPITFTANNLSAASHKVIVRIKSNNEEWDFGEDCYSGDELSNGISLKTISSGDYSIETYWGCTPPGSIVCPLINFSTNPTGGSVNTNPTCYSPVGCEAGYGEKELACDGDSCGTALGPIPTTVEGFIKSIFGIILSISGGIAVLLIIISGYKLTVSQGNPDKVKEAQEQLTAAIIGLLFVIFSLVILETIGVDILGLPGVFGG